MSADVIEWLRSPEGEEWSRGRTHHAAGAGLAPWRSEGPPVLEDDPCGRPPLTPEEIAAREAP